MKIKWHIEPEVQAAISMFLNCFVTTFFIFVVISNGHTLATAFPENVK